MLKATIDFETYSEAGYTWTGEKWQGSGISLTGSEAYSAHPSTEITRLSYCIPGYPIFGWNAGDPPPGMLLSWIRKGGLVEAHNAEFEAAIWANVAVKKLGWPPLPIEQIRCSAAKCRKYGLPGKLELAASILGSFAKLDNSAMRLICRPWTPTKKRPEHRYTRLRYPELWEKQALYCDGDVRAEIGISEILPDLDGIDLAAWQAEFRLNRRGVEIDIPLCIAGVKLAELEAERGNQEIAKLTDGTVSSFTETAKITKFCGLPNLQKETVAETLKDPFEDPKILRLLEIRQELSGGSVTKYKALINWANGSRLRNAYIWHGTHPGRHTGTGPQPANFPRGENLEIKECKGCGGFLGRHLTMCPRCGSEVVIKVDWNPKAAEQAISELKTFDPLTITNLWGPIVPLLGSCLRGAFISAPGYDLISSDYTAIQAVILAALAGEQWRLEVFRTHGQIYLASAAAITGRPIEEYLDYAKREGHHHPIRRLGKVAELASGFKGWINSWKVFGADKFIDSDEEIKRNILAWREASPFIVHLWYSFEDCAISAVLRPGETFEYSGIRFQKINEALIITTRAGRNLWYRSPELRTTDKYIPKYRHWPDYPGPRDTLSLSYQGYNSNPQLGPVGWLRRDTWDGKLTENIVMATEVDIANERKLALEKAGYFPVLETYDEITTEVPEGFGSVEEQERIMTDFSETYRDWPIKAAGGWRGKRFRKG